MNNKKILLTFVGGTDLNSNNAAIEQILTKHRDIAEVHIFITKDFEDKFEASKRLKLYKSISKATFEIHHTGIENPTKQKEIYEKIEKILEQIRMRVEINKDLGLINLSSGTPDIKIVWSVLLAIGVLPNKRFIGVYAPNPEYDKEIRLDDLRFYKNSYEYNMYKLFIEKSNYLALSEYLSQNKVTEIIDKDFIPIVNFAKARFVCDYDTAYNIFVQYELDKYFRFKKPKNLFEKSIEYLYSARVAIENNDYFASIMKLGIIRENLYEYLIDRLLGYDNIGDKEEENKPYMFNLDKIRKNEPSLETYLKDVQKKSNAKNKEFNFKGEINAYSKKLIFEYLVKYKYKDVILEKIWRKFNSIEELAAKRNSIAHTITQPIYQKRWLKEIEYIIKYSATYFNIETQEFSSTNEEINRVLAGKIKI